MSPPTVPEDWALLPCVRQVTLHSPVACSAGRRDGAELATLLSLVVAVTQRCQSPCPSCGARKWQKPGCALPRVLASCSHTHIPPLWQAKPFVSDRRLLPPARPLAREITEPTAPKGQPLPVPIAWVTRVQRAGQSVMVPGDVQDFGISLAHLGRQGHHPLLLPRGL